MPKKSEILAKDTQKKLEELKEVDILVGIPSYNNARTIGHVVRAGEAGLSKYFSNYKAILVNSDGGSTDGTVTVARRFDNVEVRDVSELQIPIEAAPGGFVTPEAEQTNILIDWAMDKRADWII